MNEAVDLAQNRPLSVEADVYVWRYALLVVHARKEEGGDIRCTSTSLTDTITLCRPTSQSCVKLYLCMRTVI